MIEARTKIIIDYARWTVLSALRSGSPVKSRKEVYGLLDKVDFAKVLRGKSPTSTDEFNAWHRAEVQKLHKLRRALGAGWAAKMINIYLKTAVYVGDLGRPGLRKAIHPPIDSRLLGRLRKCFPDLFKEKKKVHRIKEIREYFTYKEIIEKCRLIAEEMHCSLIEVDQFWDEAQPCPNQRSMQ